MWSVMRALISINKGASQLAKQEPALVWRYPRRATAVILFGRLLH